jgi:hypothetical protein
MLLQRCDRIVIYLGMITLFFCNVEVVKYIRWLLCVKSSQLEVSSWRIGYLREGRNLLKEKQGVTSMDQRERSALEHAGSHFCNR